MHLLRMLRCVAFRDCQHIPQLALLQAPCLLELTLLLCEDRFRVLAADVVSVRSATNSCATQQMQHGVV